jgi:hypothetical protein
MSVRAVVVSLSLLFLFGAAPVPENPAASAQPVADWTFQGCFSTNGSTPCYDVYSHNGASWICSACGTTKRPTESKCRRLSAYELTNGRWCS